MKRKTNYNAFTNVGLILLIILFVILSFQINAVNTSLNSMNSKLDLRGSSHVEETNQNLPSQALQQQPKQTEPKIDMDALSDDDAIKGSSDAPVTIVEFSDFECPFCARFYSQTLSQIEEQYINTGKVKLIYRDFPLGFHSNAQKAAEAAECAGEQGKYWEMHNELFEKGVKGGVGSFKQFAQELGLNTENFDDCLDSGKMASEVQKDMQDGAALGIKGTPGFIVNGKLVSGAQPFNVFKQVIEAELG